MPAFRHIASVGFAALAASLSLLACSSGGLDIANADLPSPAVSQGTAVLVCGSPAGSATLALSDVGTEIITGVPNQAIVDTVTLVGSSTGLDPATHSVVILLLPLDADCPAYANGLATLLGDGSFGGDLEFPDDVTTFRAVAIVVPTGTVVSCGAADTCVNAAGFLAQSNALEIRP